MPQLVQTKRKLEPFRMSRIRIQQLAFKQSCVEGWLDVVCANNLRQSLCRGVRCCRKIGCRGLLQEKTLSDLATFGSKRSIDCISNRRSGVCTSQCVEVVATAADEEVTHIAETNDVVGGAGRETSVVETTT